MTTNYQHSKEHRHQGRTTANQQRKRLLTINTARDTDTKAATQQTAQQTARNYISSSIKATHRRQTDNNTILLYYFIYYLFSV